VLFAGADGVERVVGLASDTGADCAGPGAAARIDAQRAFIASIVPGVSAVPESPPVAGAPDAGPVDPLPPVNDEDGGCQIAPGRTARGTSAVFALFGILMVLGLARRSRA
jgi:hypothetical protein